MNISKKIIAYILVFATALSFSVVPAFASSGETASSTGTFWQSVAANSPDWLKAVLGLVSDGVCSVSDDAKHHGYVIGSQSGVALCRCNDCSELFTVDTAFLQSSYNTYTDTLPASGVGSDGYLYWSPSFVDFGLSYKKFGSYYKRWFSEFPSYYSSVSSDFLSFHFRNDSDNYPVSQLDGKFSDVLPITGYYSVFSYPYVDIQILDNSGVSTYKSGNFNRSGDISGLLDSGSSYSVQCFFDLSDSSCSYAVCSIVPPVYRIKPLDGLIDTTTDTTYNPDSRPSSLSGITYGYQDSNGDIVVYTDHDGGFFNEVGGYLWNPETKETVQVKSWTYDYVNRRYELVLPDETKATVQYADNETIVTVPSGDTYNTYNYYYMLPPEETPDPGDGGGSGGSGDSGGGSGGGSGGHQHSYTSAITKEPTCTLSGVKTFTCSECNDSYTENVPPAGHAWEVKKQVPTEYDEEGNLVTQGYTIYKCSVCGEESKSADGTSPPSGSEPTEEESKGGFFSWLWGAIKLLCSKLFSGVTGLLDFLFPDDGQNNWEFYTKPSTFGGTSVWE